MAAKKERLSIITGMRLPVFVLILLLASGCGENTDKDNTNAGKDDPGPVIMSETEKASPDEFEYSFNPHVISEEYKTIYGEGIDEEFFSLCDAILMKEKTFPCSSKERFHQLLSISNSCFPLAQELIDKDGISVDDGVCHLAYRYDEKETDEIILTFKNKVADVISSAVPYEEPDHIKAMELFTAVANKDVYDESYTLEDSLKLKSYRAVMNDIGICQEIASEYIYYLLQVGINAIPCSSLNADRSEAHEWVLAELDGRYYHMDPTYATNHPDSLFFFGMDDVQREYYGDFPKDNYTYAESDALSECAATDRRFEKVWLAEKYEIDHIERKIIITEIDTGKRYEYGFD